MKTVGVLALQGAFKKHMEMLQLLGVHVLLVKKPEDLEKCNGLIIPGGESTVISRQMDFIGLTEKIREFGAEKPVFGTCAGLILMAENIFQSDMKPFNFLSVDVERNAFGRQADSFLTDVEIRLNPKKQATIFPAIFIRAPRIRKCSLEVEVLASFEEEPILVRQGHHLGATFHPELTNDTSIHAYFLKML
ncbi:MAG TPA: pyridoxal 5'-phosphate synthase glutaminase subunit PdxT [Parachlamydiaceae bacterium]|nr:pyridoxal 5'-phosphate synthase glutaminase subunit PdxT [Parachlamydiaceae bacterium]